MLEQCAFSALAENSQRSIKSNLWRSNQFSRLSQGLQHLITSIRIIKENVTLLFLIFISPGWTNDVISTMNLN